MNRVELVDHTMPHLRVLESEGITDEELWAAIAVSAAHTAITITDVTNVADGVLKAFKERFRNVPPRS